MEEGQEVIIVRRELIDSEDFDNLAEAVKQGFVHFTPIGAKCAILSKDPLVLSDYAFNKMFLDFMLGTDPGDTVNITAPGGHLFLVHNSLRLPS